MWMNVRNINLRRYTWQLPTVMQTGGSRSKTPHQVMTQLPIYHEFLIVHITGVPSQSNVRNFMQPTLLPNGPATPTSSFFNAGLSMSFPFAQTMERSANYTLGFAPIFEDITITPYYDQPQLFSSNTLNGDYPAVDPFETPDHTLETPAPEPQGGYGQTNGRTGAIPY